MVEPEIRRLTRLLEALVRVKKVPVRQLERRLGFGGGTLNRIFSGRIELKVRHIMLVLDDLGVPAVQFFKTAYADGMESATPEQLLAALNRRGLAEPLDLTPVEPGSVTLAEFRKAMTEILDEVRKGSRARAEPAPPEPDASPSATMPPAKPRPRKPSAGARRQTPGRKARPQKPPAT
ncbi:MAG TPA: hypothetical protein VEW48_24870 [Thermoanaerobaculia bacterium]|nr:hypothetical protein [Thermoanaerobaculia bacterium]